MKKLAALVLACACLTLQAQSQTLDPHQKLALDTYRELIEINTVHPHGDNTAAARAMAKRLLDAGFSSFDDYWSPVEAGGGRLGQAYLGLPTRIRTDVRRHVHERLAPLTKDGKIVMDIEAYLALGQVRLVPATTGPSGVLSVEHRSGHFRWRWIADNGCLSPIVKWGT